MKLLLFTVSGTIMFLVFAILPNLLNKLCDKIIPVNFDLETVCIYSIAGSVFGLLFVGALTAFSNEN